jgi:hypothetical protein
MIQPITMIRRIAFRDMDDRRRSLDAKPGSPAPPFAAMVGKLLLFMHFYGALGSLGAGPAASRPGRRRADRRWRDS